MKVQNKGAITGLSCSPDGVQIMAAGGDCTNAGVAETITSGDNPLGAKRRKGDVIATNVAAFRIDEV
jgi:hypothetical protein